MNYVFIKFKLVDYRDEIKARLILSKFLKEILKNEKDTKLVRLETLAYSFEENDIEFIKKSGFEFEVEKKEDIFFNDKLQSAFLYSAVDQEIEKIINFGDELLEDIQIDRHNKINNKYLKEIIKYPEMIRLIYQNEVLEINEDESSSIDYLIKKKKIFPFTLFYKGNVIGFFCLDNIDWENKNCRFKGGIFQDYVEKIQFGQVKKCIEYVVNFLQVTLGLRRVSGVIRENSFAVDVFDEIFTREGSNINKTLFYYGNVKKREIGKGETEEKYW